LANPSLLRADRRRFATGSRMDGLTNQTIKFINSIFIIHFCLFVCYYYYFACQYITVAPMRLCALRALHQLCSLCWFAVVFVYFKATTLFHFKLFHMIYWIQINRQRGMTAQSLCIFVILTLNSCTATFWNWLITNPHDLETDISSSNLRHDSPVPSPSRPNYVVAKLHSKNSPRPRHKHHHISTTTPPPPPPLQTASISTAQLSRLDDRSSNDEPGQLTCHADRECPLNLFCDLHYGLCKPYKTEQEPCRSDSQCAIGYDCMFGRCTMAAKPGHKGARCTGNRDCLPGLCCARQHGDKVCKPKLQIGQSCFVPDGGLSYWLNELCPCDDGLVCALSPQSADPKSMKIDWFQLWTESNQLHCISIHSSSGR
ncbi:Dickkopf-related protein 3, partial [Trichinella nativa]